MLLRKDTKEMVRSSYGEADSFCIVAGVVQDILQYFSL